MTFNIITLFPAYFEQALHQSLIGKGQTAGHITVNLIDLRDHATDKHRTVDDTPFGGGGGMVLKVEPLDRCLQALGHIRRNDAAPDEIAKQRIVLTSAAGKRFTQPTAIEWSLTHSLTIICGHYLGIDERLMELYAIDEVSIGDFVLTGGEPAALVMIDAVARLIPGVLGNFESALNDSHMDATVGAPVYTKPATYDGLNVPDELTSGNHQLINQWRRRAALTKSLANRPDLLADADLTPEEERWLGAMKTKKTN